MCVNPVQASFAIVCTTIFMPTSNVLHIATPDVQHVTPLQSAIPIVPRRKLQSWHLASYPQPWRTGFSGLGANTHTKPSDSIPGTKGMTAAA